MLYSASNAKNFKKLEKPTISLRCALSRAVHSSLSLCCLNGSKLYLTQKKAVSPDVTQPNILEKRRPDVKKVYIGAVQIRHNALNSVVLCGPKDFSDMQIIPIMWHIGWPGEEPSSMLNLLCYF